MAKKAIRPMRFEIPFTSTPPLLRSEALGFTRVVERRSAGYTVDVTIIDTPDNRLLRAGVVLAHRVIGGLGEWYLAAPSWEPWLPAEDTEQLDASAEMPERMASRVRPLARRGVLGPVAALHCERSEYVLAHSDGTVWATIRDERVTVRRGGVTTARYRELTVMPARVLSSQQREFILTSMDASSATGVGSFPTLQQRLGAPATGLSDFPSPQAVRKRSDLEDFVSAVFAGDLMQLVETLLALTADEAVGTEILRTHLEKVRRDVRGLGSVLEPEWFQHMVGLTRPVPGESNRSVVERAIDVVDALVGAVRAPRLGDASNLQARQLLFEHAHQATSLLSDRCRDLSTSSSSAEFAAAKEAADQALTRSRVTGYVLGRSGVRMVGRLESVAADLESCIADESEPDLDGVGAHEAFEMGVRSERERQRVLVDRQRFVDAWPAQQAALRQLMAKVGRKL